MERGASADADFDLGKRLPLPDLRGRVIAGKDDMGGSAPAERLTNVGEGNSNIAGTKLGSSGGADRLTLTREQLAPHTHGPGSFAINGGAHTHTLATWNTNVNGHFKLLRASATGTDRGTAALNKQAINDSMWDASTHSHPTNEWSGASAENTPSGQAHPIVQPTIILNYLIKL
ncbi:MAG: hypothetical protein EOP06_05970 [Proteobacteria bacterium]|nr:MAG: hypothetical protein EOP06_05970 [Pseudomonadota bacterium]